MNSNRTLLVIFLTIFLDLVGFGILIPVIPQLLANVDSPYYLLSSSIPISHGYIMLGFLIASFPIAQFFAAPILGELSDVYGRKKILVISLFGTALSYIMFAIGILTRNIPLLFISRFLDGATGGNISVAQAAIADITTEKNRARNFGLIGAAFGLGFITGPFLGGILSDPHYVSWFNAATPFWFSGILSLMNTFFVVVYFKETYKKPAEKVIQWTKAIVHIFNAYALKSVRAIFATNFLYQSGFTFFATFFAVFLIHRFSFTQTEIGNYFAYVGIWIVFSQAVITRRVSDMFREERVIPTVLLLGGGLIFAHFLPETGKGLLLIAPFFAVVTGLAMANLPALISRRAPAHAQGEVLGINTSVQALAQAIPPILSGFFAATIHPTAPVFISGGIIVFAGIFFWVTVCFSKEK